MNCAFPEIKKNFGFGFMRLPMKDEAVDHEAVCRMVDDFLQAGFNYFDTAHGYLGGKSEPAVREALVKRYPRESYVLTDKLTGDFFQNQEDIRPLMDQMLEACGVEYFDFLLMHCQTQDIYAKFKSCRAYETALELMAEGKFRHFGISFHDKAALLEQILQDYPQIETVQLQFNYADYDDTSVESRKCYDVCVKYGKPVIVMEPVKGGSLANLPREARSVLDALPNPMSSAAYAIRFAASFDHIAMVLSGMSTPEQMLDNLSAMKDFAPLSEQEHEAIRKVCDIFRSQNLIACTACRYCTDGCPMHIDIPALFACLNAKKTFNSSTANYYYENIHTSHGGKASSCIGCGLCEASCPQHLPIRQLLKDVAAEFEK